MNDVIFNGIVIDKKPFSSSSLILTIISENSIIKSLYKGGQRSNVATIGNFMRFEKFGKKDGLGFVSCEIIQPYGLNYEKEIFMLCLMVLSIEIRHVIKHSYLHNEDLYQKLLNFLHASVNYFNDDEIFNYLIEIENEILFEYKDHYSKELVFENINQIFNIIIKDEKDLKTLTWIRNLILKKVKKIN